MSIEKKLEEKPGVWQAVYKRIIDMKISRKLAISYLAGAAACMLILSFFYYTNTKYYIDTQTKELLQQTLNQAKGNIDDKVVQYNLLADSVGLNTNLQDILFNEYPTPSERLDALTLIFGYSRPLKSSYKDLLGVSLIICNSTIPAFGNEIIMSSTVEDEEWYNDIIKASNKTIWLSDNETEKSGRLVLGRKLNHTLFDSFLGVLRVELNPDSFFNSLMEVSKNGRGWFDIIDSKGNFIYKGMNHEDAEVKNSIYNEYKKLLFTEHRDSAVLNLNDVQYMTLQDTIEYTGWNIIYTIPLSSFTDAVKKLQIASLGFLLLCALLFIGISWSLASVFTKKIRELSYSMEKIQTGQFDVYITYPGNDEIGHLIGGFNVMARKLKELVEEVYTIKIKEKESELKALQAQINPHFLYNTLASISMLGMRVGGEDITNMSNSLARFYKIALSKGNSIIRVRDEIEHIKAYIAIQGIRFKNKINMQYDVDETVLEANTLKLMLQPFVENSIGHGLWKDKKFITIRLVVRREENQIIWEIIDDGIGISRKNMEEILRSDENSEHGYGIVNVDQRIKLYFGDAYGVNIFSRSGIGTVITINTPFEANRDKTELG